MFGSKRSTTQKDTAPRHGRLLVKAVKSPFGGDDPKLAEKIAKDHPLQPSGGKSGTHTRLNNEEGRV